MKNNVDKGLIADFVVLGSWFGSSCRFAGRCPCIYVEICIFAVDTNN